MWNIETRPVQVQWIQGVDGDLINLTYVHAIQAHAMEDGTFEIDATGADGSGWTLARVPTIDDVRQGLNEIAKTLVTAQITVGKASSS